MNGTQMIIDFWRQKGIRHIAGIPGGYNLPLYDAIEAADDIQHHLVRHEQGAGFLAQGQARMDGRPAFCLATSGPGATNLLTALADAWADGIPLIALTGQVSTGLLGSRAFQEVDICAMAAPVCKKTYLVRDAQEIPAILEEAWNLALQPRSGPVLIDIPKDVQQQSCHQPLPVPSRSPSKPFHALADRQKMLDLLKASRRPMIYAGGGLNRPPGAARNACRLSAFLQGAELPVIHTLMATGLLPKNHPCNLGMMGMHGEMSTNRAIEECDLLIVLGARFDDRATGRLQAFAPYAKVLHVDSNGDEQGRLRASDVFLEMDAGDFIWELADAWAQTYSEEREEAISAWWRHIYMWQAELQMDCGQSGPRHLMQFLGRAIPFQSVIATDVGQHQMWTAMHFPLRQPGSFLTSGGMGTMGFGLPVAMGAALQSGRPVLLISGDGSIQMNIQELATLTEMNLDVRIVVLKNASLGLVKQQQDLFFRGAHSASEFIQQPNLNVIAKGYGIESAFFEWSEMDDRSALEWFLHAPGPRLAEVAIPSHWMVLPMIPPGGTARDSIVKNEHHFPLAAFAT